MKKSLLFWGKTLQEKNATNSGVVITKSHPLLFHMVDVASVAEKMFERVISDHVKKNLKTLYRNEDDSSLSSKVAFLAGLHDLGKATPPFQGLWFEGAKKLSAEGLKFPPVNDKTKNHGWMTSSLIFSEFEPTKDKDKLINQIGRKMAISLGGHHGLMSDCYVWQDFADHKFFSGSASWLEARKELLSDYYKCIYGMDMGEKTLKKAILEALPKDESLKILQLNDSFFAFLSGLVSVADWVGSSADWFEFHEPDDSTSAIDDYLNHSRESAARAVDNVWPEETGEQKMFANGEELFSYIFPEISQGPRPLQKKCIDIAPTSSDGKMDSNQIVIIEAPTGEGKTEAAFYLFDSWQRQNVSHGAYIALPTMATSNQMFSRFKNFLSRGHGEKITLNLLHSMKFFNDDFRELKIVGANDQGYSDTIVANSWFQKSKRGLITPYAVGTIDQSLMGALQVKHMFVRLFGLTGKTVIFDEVHAYDTYMSNLLDMLISWLSELGSSVIILSATLPEKRKRELLKAFCGDNVKGEAKNAYPAITYASKNKKIESATFQSNKEVRPIVTFKKAESSIQETADTIMDLIYQGGCAAWICNTVNQSQEVFRYLKEKAPADVELVLFHARFTTSDRLGIEDRVLSMMGKGQQAKRPKKAIVVATQVIEQSLDLDFDVMVSEFAPIDLLVQRAGRLHRHKREERPLKVSEPVMFVQFPEKKDGIPDFGPSKYIYEEYVLAKTLLTLENRLKEDSYTFSDRDDTVKKLIEEVYGDSGPDASKLEGHLKKLKKKFDEKNQEIESNARKIIIDYPVQIPAGKKQADDFRFAFINYRAPDDDDPDNPTKFAPLTRLSDGPSFKAVCLFEDGGKTYLDVETKQLVDISKSPKNIHETNSLVQNSLTISGWRNFNILESLAKPESWANSPSLKEMPVIIFKKTGGGWVSAVDTKFRYSREFGLEISKEGD
ncbi:MAG: CRISPR-associated helicase Cas3' [Caldisericales bacterium]|nr:CRISPR-associated helicase Cas3' [Caldisericales bacterium]